MKNPFRRRGHERFSGPGFIMERDGRVIRMASTLDSEGHAEMRRKLGASKDDLAQSMRGEVEELYAILHRYRPESMIGALWVRNAPMGTVGADGVEFNDETVLAHVEYVATLYVRDRGAGTQSVVPPHVVEEVQHLVEGLFHSTVWLWMAQDASRYGGTAADAQRELWFRTLLSSLVMRYPGHFDRMKQMLLDIESGMHKDLSSWLGWSIADAVAVGDAVIELVDERLMGACGRGAVEAEKQWLDAWPSGRGRVARLVKRLIPPDGRPWRTQKVCGLASWVQFLMQDIPVFRVRELALRSGVEEDRVRALMASASLSWGSCAEEFYAAPHPTPPVVVHPVLPLGGDRFLLPVPTSFTWALRSLVEECLKSQSEHGDPSGWAAYERARAGYAEQRVIALFKQALPHAGVFGGLKYAWVEEGVQKDCELDGLVLADDHAILVEIKAGTMTDAARRGAPDALRDQLEGLIGKAHEQALRAREYMSSAPAVDFETSAGGLRVHSGEMNDFLLVTVNLDALDPFTTNLDQLGALGVMREGDMPWSVSLLDLEEIVEALEFPVQLIHYVHRRLRVNELGFVDAHDEIDWFGHYLAEGLYFEHLVPAAREADGKFHWSIMGYSKELDAHFMHDDRYPGEAPALPRQKMPDEMRELLRELERTARHGYLHISLALLDLDWDARETFFRNAAELVERSEVDAQRHSMTMVLDDGEGGLTFACDVDRERLQRGLFDYCLLRKYQCHCSKWVGIGRLIGTGNWVDEALVIKTPWEFDEAMEAAVAEILPSLPTAV